MGFQLPRQSLPLPVHLLLLLCVLPFLCHAVAPAKVKSDADFLFLTFSNGSASALDVNVVLGADYSAKKSAGLSMASQLDTKGAKQTKNKLKKRYSVLNQAPDSPSSGFGSFFSSSSSGEELTLLAAKTRALAASGTVEYKVDGITSGLMKSRPLFPKGKDKYQMKVCVFGDFAQNLYEQTEMNLSDLINKEQCVFNLFIGKTSWERQLKPTPSFSFSPYVMLHSANASKHVAYARVPSIFGAVGGNQTETSFFHSTEVGDVAFIQITVEIATVADLQEGTEAYEMISQYFRELMLNELECKLQELHRRPKRPWIVLYMTHPYLVSNDEDKVQWLVMNDTSRFFEILKRYKVDLLTSCGIEGISRMLEAARVRMPEAKLPAYIQTTMAQCGGYQSVDISLQNECSYAVLDIRPDTMGYKKKGAENGGNVVTSGNIERTFEKADDCVADDEL